jgi:tRNA1Val (adenine37-N6)-methyltransferase
VLDVGTGCGVIALMIAQRNATATITGIDIDHDAIEEATLNFERSPWSERLTAVEGDFNDLQTADKYDLVVSNPPYFTNGVLPTGDARTTARHTGSLSYRQLIDGATRLLSREGILAFISPTDAESAIIEAAAFASLPIRRCTRVVPVEGAEAKRTLWLLSRREMAYVEDTLTIAHVDGTFTQEYINLTGAFYLKMPD